MITATNKHTGEFVELPVNTFEEVIQAWQIAKEYAKTADTLKEQLKKLVPKYVDETRGVSEVVNGHMFRISTVQHMTYDKAVLRQQLDEDTLDLLLEPNKTAVDAYLKDHLAELGEASTIIRKAMIPKGKAFPVIKLEKVSRDE